MRPCSPPLVFSDFFEHIFTDTLFNPSFFTNFNRESFTVACNTYRAFNVLYVIGIQHDSPVYGYETVVVICKLEKLCNGHSCAISKSRNNTYVDIMCIGFNRNNFLKRNQRVSRRESLVRCSECIPRSYASLLNKARSRVGDPQ